MDNPNLENQAARKQIIKEIEGEENYSRKREAQRRYDCYNDRGDRYIIEALREEFSEDTVQNMRHITSINLSKRVIEEQSSVYDRDPERTFENANENEDGQIKALYDAAFFNTKMKFSNRYFNLYSQGVLYFLPKDGIIEVKPLPLMSFDVIPDALDPEKPFAYILNTWDLDTHASYEDFGPDTAQTRNYMENDRRNQSIADDNDRLAKKQYIVWTDELHFTMNGNGEIIGEAIDNPIGQLPFIDFDFGKDGQFFVRRGSGLTQFHIDMGVILSDIATISRNQGYAQGVIISEKQPQLVRGNHDKWLWLQLDPNKPESTPSMEFKTPAPDIQGAIQNAEMLVNMFLSSSGLDTSTITGQATSQQFASGIERLLALIEKFEASADDFSLYKRVEQKCFKLLRLWSNELQNVTGPLQLLPELRQATLSDNIEMSVKFLGPENIKSDEDKLNIIEREIELGLSSRKKSIEKYHEVTPDKALELIGEIDEDERLFNGEGGQDKGDEIGVEPED